jgi:16S rRNA (uracil1498-N3)-methyltransferase
VGNARYAEGFAVSRFFVENIKEGATVAELSAEEFRHLRVLRLVKGDAVTILNGRGLEFSGSIESIGKDAARIRIEKAATVTTESPLDITLLQGYIKGDKPELVAQKATELGVKEIVFYSTARSVAKFREERLARLRKVAVEALKQSGRGVVPAVSFMSFKEAIRGWKDRPRVVLYENEKKRSLKDALRGVKAVVAVGPEGGFSEEEVGEAQKEGFVTVSFGPRRLRSETAAIAVISVLQFERGDMGRQG